MIKLHNFISRDTFDHLVCDQCNDSEKYPLTTKSDALKEYLLTDKLLTRHNLKYKLKKNPHNTGWGEMKLFLVCQIEELALQDRSYNMTHIISGIGLRQSVIEFI